MQDTSMEVPKFEKKKTDLKPSQFKSSFIVGKPKTPERKTPPMMLDDKS